MSHTTPPIYLHKGEHIQLLILDVDGILTDGGLYFDANGEVIKRFNIQDGLGLSLLKKVGVKLAIISGRTSQALQYRLNELGFDDIFLKVRNKVECFNQLLDKYHLEPHHVAYMGDDLLDLPLIHRAGLGITVPNAAAAVKETADCITEASGGQGAVREACEYILESKDLLDKIIDSYRNTGAFNG